MVQAFKCDVCGVEWLPRGEKFPVCCPGRECRSRKWNAGSEGLVMKPRSLGASDLGVGVGDRCIVPDQTPEESERAARKAKKARRHAELAQDTSEALPSDNGLSASDAAEASKRIAMKPSELLRYLRERKT